MEEPEKERNSGMELKVSIGLEYTRKRADVDDKIEARFTSAGLMIIGGLVVLFVIWQIVPRLIDLIP